MLPTEKAQRKQELLEKMRNGSVDDDTLQEYKEINEAEKQWESERITELANIASGILKYRVSISELLKYQHEGRSLFDQQELASELKLFTAEKGAAAPSNKSQTSARKKNSTTDDELLLFVVKGAAGAPMRIRQGDTLPVKFPASFKRAFDGQDKEEIRKSLLTNCLSQGISSSTQEYLQSEQGNKQVAELVEYIYRELAQSGN
ncbi:hypothetical protein E9531_15530 [Lampropedia puyangensis]|uniref:Uncharacterized protein n=1 Tax=Lampropedia puyangensis TaxID=1330072 RepID=A0A4S8ESE2_9BURK|nr:hypothetical protein [Lampropedia puyangensis]THT97707.1 hypothetical protein E9531_15530 [Lampropedia puyangensis]